MGIHHNGLHVDPSFHHGGNECFFVVVDHFSKMVILATYKKSIMVEDTANILFEQV
jgi:hypothetical protein